MAYTFKHGDRPVDGYTIQRAVGKGGFGEVYYAISDGGREVALKYLRDNPQVELRGVSHCINLKSPHLVAIFDVKKTTDGEYVIIMEYCSGPSLRDILIAEPKGFAPEKAAFFVREIGKGLAYLHDRGIVHRDLKPGNIFYDDGYVKIGDYGLSKFISVSRHSVQTASVGTVHYMAPEIGSGNYSRGIDIYALGVMLYEMLLGTVPFEGSTMAEVLMKHLTAQPELEALPKPFGQVIRKALQKDPNDRYQTVDEMVNDLLDVEEVRDSLAGFRPQSLDGAIQGAAGKRYDSPMPSPNPAPNFVRGLAQQAQPPFALPVERIEAMSRRVAKRMQRVSRKIEAKMDKLSGGRRERRRRERHQQAAKKQDAFAVDHPIQTGRKRRILLSALLSIGLALGLGFMVGGNVESSHGEEWGAAAGMLVIALSGAVMLARGAIKWFGVAYGPTWSMRMIQLVCAMPLLAIGSAPLLSSGEYEWRAGMAVWLGLVFMAVFANWQRTVDNAAGGEMSFGAAIWRAFCTLIVTAISSQIFEVRSEEQAIFMAAGVAGAATLILQAMAWWLPGNTDRALERLGPSSEDVPADGDVVPSPPPPPVVADAGAESANRTVAVAHSVANQPGSAAQASLANSRHPLQRWGITRAFWGIVAFVLMGGTIVMFLVSLIARDIHPHNLTAVVVALTGCFAFMLFALRKTTPLRRPGFWRETIRPFLQSAGLFGIGGTITGISREWDHRAVCWKDTVEHCLADEGRVGLVAGLVMCSLSLIVLTLFTGGKPRVPQPFLQGTDSETLEDESDAGSGPAVHRVDDDDRRVEEEAI